MSKEKNARREEAVKKAKLKKTVIAIFFAFSLTGFIIRRV